MVRTFACWSLALLGWVGLYGVAQAAPATQPVADIPALIRHLGDDDFHVRLSAARQLKNLGKEAMPALTEASKSPDPEVHAQAEAILAELNRPPVDESPVPQAAKGTVGMTSSSLSVSEEARTLDVTQTGRTIHLEEKRGEIYLKVTGLLDEKQVTREYRAKSAKELKEKHPKAFELYDQFSFSSNGVGVHVRLGPAEK